MDICGPRRLSNLAQQGQLVMADHYLNSMRQYMSIIHDEFEVLYDVVDVDGFGMDIEYKVTKDDYLAIKQARPWVFPSGPKSKEIMT